MNVDQIDKDSMKKNPIVCTEEDANGPTSLTPSGCKPSKSKTWSSTGTQTQVGAEEPRYSTVDLKLGQPLTDDVSDDDNDDDAYEDVKVQNIESPKVDLTDDFSDDDDVDDDEDEKDDDEVDIAIVEPGCPNAEVSTDQEVCDLTDDVSNDDNDGDDVKVQNAESTIVGQIDKDTVKPNDEERSKEVGEDNPSDDTIESPEVKLTDDTIDDENFVDEDVTVQNIKVHMKDESALVEQIDKDDTDEDLNSCSNSEASGDLPEFCDKRTEEFCEKEELNCETTVSPNEHVEDKRCFGKDTSPSDLKSISESKVEDFQPITGNVSVVKVDDEEMFRDTPCADAAVNTKSGYFQIEESDNIDVQADTEICDSSFASFLPISTNNTYGQPRDCSNPPIQYGNVQCLETFTRSLKGLMRRGDIVQEYFQQFHINSVSLEPPEIQGIILNKDLCITKGEYVMGNHFKLEEILGQGTFGTVYVAIDSNTNHVFAAKKVQLDRRWNENEVLIPAKHNSSRLAEMYGLLYVHGGLRPHMYICQEYAEGGSLATYIQYFGPFKEEEVVYVLQEMLFALKGLHANNVIHHDLKASNIALNGDGEIRIIDFGAGIQYEGEAFVHGDKWMVPGTEPFMAPELITNTEHTTQVDIWSLGATAIELLIGKCPWHDLLPIVVTLQYKIGNNPTDILRYMPGHISTKLKCLLIQMLRPEAMQRPTAERLIGEFTFLPDIIDRGRRSIRTKIALLHKEPDEAFSAMHSITGDCMPNKTTTATRQEGVSQSMTIGTGYGKYNVHVSRENTSSEADVTSYIPVTVQDE